MPEGKAEAISRAFSGMMRVLHREKGAMLRIGILREPDVQAFIEAHTDALDASMAAAPLSSVMRERLSQSNYVFSGIKTFHELNEAFPSLVDANGERKPFERFLNDVRKVDETYNRNYLRAEYNFVSASSQMAARWEQFAADGDDYNLQYRTAADDLVRPEHAALHGVTLPPSDPFWQVYYPPNGWNCRCTVVQVRKEKYPVTDHNEAITRGEQALRGDKKGMFRFNSGLQGKSVPDYNPYTISRCRDCDIASKLASGIFDSDLCQACQQIRDMLASRQITSATNRQVSRLSTLCSKWAGDHLDEMGTKKNPCKRTLISTADSHTLGVGKNFFTETIAKNKRNRLLPDIVEAAMNFKSWMPTATLLRVEPGIDHNCSFSVYSCQYMGRTIEFKCRKTEGELVHTMRFI